MSKRGISLMSDSQSFSNDDYNSEESSPNQSVDFSEDSQPINEQRKRSKNTHRSNDQSRNSLKEPSEEELRKKENRRQRNKIAAAKCRQKRIDQLKSLGEEVELLKLRNKAMERANLNLFKEFEKLEKIWREHNCHMGEEDRKSLESIFSNPELKKLSDELKSGKGTANEVLSGQFQKTTTEHSINKKQNFQNNINSNINMHNIIDNDIHSKDSNYNTNVNHKIKQEYVSSNSCNGERNFNSPKESLYNQDFKTVLIETPKTQIDQLLSYNTIVNSYNEVDGKREINHNQCVGEIPQKQPPRTIETSEKIYTQSLRRPTFFPGKFSNNSVELPKDIIRDDFNPLLDNNFQSDEKVNLFALGNDVTGLTPVANNVQYPTLLDTPTPMGDKEFQIL
ncbi:Fos transforming protein family and Basic-leucine zipper domain-containing protein [Strongyloides ratti]|uniref:Fos transforming protein family and Basic-leucine zipper domain-containing protein n=1 Tax=Strongyloides ratti TaxID=34506 RepID=A0A090LH04_STRRB|nr:Fos transforming protein family and Basic-leucine zipper domain-containing protein [Strongyloides ratti]CEF69062.1 Fos transforming protein family and Basic-leucine zipper domain-containing protein [Strongyloides ratti]